MSFFVYVVEIGEGMPVKIGLTSNLDARLRQIQTMCPLAANYAFVFAVEDRPTAYRLENSVHEFLCDLRVKNEWFDIEAQSAGAAIRGMAAYAGIAMSPGQGGTL